MNDLSFQFKALNITRNELPDSKSLGWICWWPMDIVFIWSWIEGYDDKILDIRHNLFFEKILYEVLVPMLRSIIEMQLKNNAEIVYMFDTNAKQMNSDYFVENYFPKLKSQIFDFFPQKIAYFQRITYSLKILKIIVKNNLAGMVYNEAEGMSECLAKTDGGFLQGNFSPNSLLQPKSDFILDLDEFINEFKKLSQKRKIWMGM